MLSEAEGMPQGHGYFPLSAAQSNIYFAQKLAPQVPFTIAHYVEIRGEIDPATLIRATDIASRELGSPCIRIIEIDGHPYQWYDDHVPYATAYRDLRATVDPVAHAQAYMDEQYRKPLDLIRDQLVASEIIQVGDAHYYWYSRAHHIVLDGLGAISIQERSAVVYTALMNGTEIPGARAVGLREIYDYEAAYTNSTRYVSDKQHWEGRLAEHTDTPRLAGTPTSGVVPSDISVSVGAELDPQITRAMADLARRHNSTDVPVVLAAFALYLGRMTDTEDVLLSLPVSGRTTTKLRGSAGMMSNVVPLRIGVEAVVTVEELLGRIQVELTGALRHQRFRVEDMQRAVGSAVGGAAGRGLFGPTVNIMMYDSRIRLGEVVGDYHVLSSGPIDDLMVNVYPGVAGASTRVDFLGNPSVYSTSELAAHHERFLSVLRALVDAPDGLVTAELDVFGAAEQDPGTGSVAPAVLHALRNSSTIIRSGNRDHAGVRFFSDVEHSAAQLVTRGIGPEMRVAIALERSYFSVLASWAVSTAGASFVPVDPQDPTDRLTAMLTDAGVGIGITSRASMATLPAGVEWIAIEDLLDAAPVEFVPPAVHLDNEAYVIHTSGSTGKPKAVSVTHRGLAQLAASVVERYSVSSTSRVLHLASPTFDASIQEILAGLASGATLVIAPADVYAGPALAEFLARERITHLVTSPTVLSTLEPENLAGIEVFDVGGEDCPPGLRDRFFAQDRTMLNAYGPTETTVLATLSEPLRPNTRMTIGAPLPGVRAQVLDLRLRSTPPDGIGELYLGGDGLARGYDGRPGLTAARFVADPSGDGARLYRTGDVVRRSSDGLVYLGRRDQQVQLHGRRLELGEIETVAAASEGVTAAAVVIHEDRLVAYVTGDTTRLDEHLRRHLPSWTVPSAVVALESLPRTAGGKIDRRALPKPTNSSVTEFVAPRSGAERDVAAVFTEVLGAQNVGRDHTFFELGGDSLSATRVVARLGSRVPMSVLFQTPTVAAVAAALDSSVVEENPLDLLQIVIPDRVPLSYAQQRLWFLNQFDTSSPAYNMPVAVRVRRDSDPALVMTALRDVVERHESLRTYFPDDAGSIDHSNGPSQEVRPTAQVLAEIPTRAVSEDELDAAIAEFVSTGFDVAIEVPIRAGILQVEGGTVVVLVVHHIAMDGWSINALVRDFVIAHTARAAGHGPSWDRLAAQYGHYAVWNRAVVDSVADEQLRYWTSVLGRSSEPVSAELPADRPRPPVQSMVTAEVPFVVDSLVHARMREAARAVNATTFMVVHAALATTLSRFSGFSRTVIGSPSAGRGHPALDDMVGMFVGTVPLVVTVDPEASFSDLVASVRHADLDAFAHADVPFDRIVEALGGDRSLDRHPLFQVMLAFDNTAHQRIDDLPVEVLPVATHTSEYDLNLVLTDTTSGIEGHIEYAVDLYDQRTVEQFGAVLGRVLRAVVEDPSLIVGDLELASVAVPAVDHRADATPGTLLDVYNPAEIAVDGERRLSRTELDERSNKLARLLISHGAGSETLVALSIPRSAEFIVALWAVVKAGAAFVPVDPGYPGPRRAHMLAHVDLGVGGADSGVRWVSESDAEAFSSDAVTADDRNAALMPAHPAYVIHTSGSTGTPKPVTVTHASVHALAQQVIPRYGVTTDSRVLHGYSVNFDAAVLELVLAFGAGATMVIAPQDLQGGGDIGGFLVEHSVTHYLSTPAVLATVPPIAGITTVAVGGDVLGSDVVREWSPGRTMLNAYGPTEATVVATLTDPLDAATPVTIGRPLNNVAALVLDARLKRVPLGGVGELYLGGTALARGYGSNAALTAERFVAGPSGKRLYRTGDLVRVDSDGVYSYCGRLDSQVQIRGVRVELGDIEAALTAHPEVQSAVAAVRDGHVLAWVVGVDEKEAKRWLLERLPLSLLPAVITPIERIPVTANGKVDTAALETPAHGDPTGVRTLAEQVVLGIFVDALGTQDVSADSNFFVLGGDSLAATRVAGRIAAALGTRVPVRTIFEAPTPRMLVAAIDEQCSTHTPLPALVRRAEAPDYTGLAPAEHRIWLQNRFDPTSAAYNIAFQLPLPIDIDLGALHAAVIDVVQRHSPLRTVYPSGIDGPTIEVLDAQDVVFADTRASAASGFDLTVEPPVRLTVTTTEDEVLLTVVAHHIAVDGLSLAPLARDVDTALTARLAGVAPEFAPLAVDYSDYRLWQQDVLASVATEQLDFWREALAGMPDFLELPSGTTYPDDDASPIEFHLDTDSSGKLQALANRLGATPFVVVHAALAIVLAEASGTRDIAIGTPVSGRGDPALDDLVGMFVGTVVLRTDVDPAKTFEEFVVDVRNRDLDAFANSAVPFEWVVEAVQPTRDVDSHPLFQVLLAFGELEPPALDMGTTPRRIDIAATQFDLEVVVDTAADGLTGSLAYSGARFSRSVCVSFAERLTSVLELAAERSDLQLGSAPFFGRRETIARNPGVSEKYTLRALFERSAQQWGPNTAVIDGTIELTYDELDRRSAVVADKLVRSGAGPGMLVAIALPRSADFVTAVWAVAKTGAGYLPVDPTQPVARVREILAHAQPITGIARDGFESAGPGWLTVAGVHHLEAVPDMDHGVREEFIDDSAYVIYTSGSTGAPKGVRVTHRGIADLVQSQRELFSLTPSSRVLQFASTSFDASVFEMLLAFGSGAAAVVVPADVYAGRELEELIDAHAVTHICLTPTVLQVTDPQATPTVEVVVMAGEAANSELLQRWSVGHAVFDAYGPTETTIMGTCTTSRYDGSPVTIGGPVRGFDAVVLDDRLRPVGDGVVGELYLGGSGLAEGYVGQSGLTSNRFVPNPYDAGKRLYRTGDLVRWRDSELEYLGRVDSQVKIRGHRVELAEVEAALLKHTGIEQACVLGHAGGLAAYIVGTTTPRDARDFLAETVPAFMVPSTFTVVEEVPKSLAGKVDTSRLPVPVPPSTVKAVPSTPLEHVVRNAFADVLLSRADSIGVDDNFFDLGGHSLSVVRVIDAVSAELDRPIPVTALLTNPTVRALAATLAAEDAQAEGAFDVLLPIRSDGENAPLFCVHPAVGIAWSYFSLLGETDRPLYGLQVPGMTSGEAPPSSIEEFAARYVREIKDVQPDGPYHVLGWSLGGVIAHAVATQLTEEGDVVASLVLVDAQLSQPHDAAEFGVDELARQLGVEGSSFDDIAAALRTSRSELGFLGSDHLRAMYEPVFRAPTWTAAYRPRRYEGDVDYFAARGSRGAEQWERYVDGHISVWRVDADHQDMLSETGARALGRVLGGSSVTEGVA